MDNKTTRILHCTEKVQEILDYLRPDNKWEIAYDKPEHVSLSDWERNYHNLYDREDYFFVFIDGKLVYTINVTGDNELTAIYELIEKLAKKF